MTLTILLLAGAYALLAAFLLLILISARMPIALKALATLAAAALVPWTYHGIGELRGLPTDSEPPAHFKLHWARVVEPNLLMKEKGHVFLWIEELDDQNSTRWVAHRIDMPRVATMLRRLRTSASRAVASRPADGSSKSRRRGCDNSARAISTLRWLSPDSLRT